MWWYVANNLFFPLISLIFLKFTMVIQDFRVVLSYTDISTLVFFLLFLIFFLVIFSICFQFHHWIYNFNFLFLSNMVFILLIVIFLFWILFYNLFFFQFYSSIFYWLGIGFCVVRNWVSWFLDGVFQYNDLGHEFKKLTKIDIICLHLFFKIFIIRPFFFFKKMGFMIFFILGYPDLMT
jgi:hypothetical protein